MTHMSTEPANRWLASPYGYVWLAALAFAFPGSVAADKLENFDGRITRAQLEHYLSRAITMEGLLTDHGKFEDELRLLKTTGVRFAGRAIYRWGAEDQLAAVLRAAQERERKLHAELPQLMLQAAVFEIVTEGVSANPIPPRVFKEFELPVETRSFAYEAMLFPNGKFRNHWGKGRSVPDITRQETQLWFYFLATSYIDLGVEAIHFGQVALIGATDRDHHAWDSLLQRVRAYAREHARRGIVICDAHVPTGGVRVGERLLFDFHSFPLRIDEDGDDPTQGVLRMGYLDSIYGRSLGGTTPSGWKCAHLPYLVELDNFGRSRQEGKNIDGAWIWGYDEICWFAHLSAEQRSRWLRYAHQWVRAHDPNGFLQMPGSRTLASPANGSNWYWASKPSSLCPQGFGDEDTIREIWSGK